MAAKPDPKDDKIDELELSLEAANKAISEAEAKSGSTTAMAGEIEKLKAALGERDKTIKGLRCELAAERSKSMDGEKATVPGLPATAGQLNAPVIISDVKGGTLYTQNGDVLATGSDDDVAKLRRTVGTSAVVHHVSKETLEAQRTASRLRA
jgi:hypothetical protein